MDMVTIDGVIIPWEEVTPGVMTNYKAVFPLHYDEELLPKETRDYLDRIENVMKLLEIKRATEQEGVSGDCGPEWLILSVIGLSIFTLILLAIWSRT